MPRPACKFQYTCVYPPDMKELDFIIVNARQITWSPFYARVDRTDLRTIEKSLGYRKRSWSLPMRSLSSDPCVTFYSSHLRDGRKAYYFIHSAIEYIFYEEK